MIQRRGVVPRTTQTRRHYFIALHFGCAKHRPALHCIAVSCWSPYVPKPKDAPPQQRHKPPRRQVWLSHRSDLTGAMTTPVAAPRAAPGMARSPATSKARLATKRTARGEPEQRSAQPKASQSPTYPQKALQVPPPAKSPACRGRPHAPRRPPAPCAAPPPPSPR